MSRNRKIALWSAGVIAGIALLLAAASVLVPLFINQRLIRGKIEASISRSIGGTIDFERLDVSLLPPQGRLSNVSLSIPGKDIVGTAESTTAYLKLLPLIMGRVEFKSIEIIGPDFRVGVPQGRLESEKVASGVSLENLAGGAYAGLSELHSLAPDIKFLIRKGRLSLTREGEPLIEIQDLDGQMDLPPDGIALDIRSASNLWENFRIAARVNERLQGSGRIEFTHLKPQLLAPLMGPRPQVAFGDSQVDADLRFKMKGYSRIEGEIEASAPKLTLRRSEGSVPLKVDSLKGAFRFAGREREFRLAELSLGNPGMSLSGRVHLDTAGPSASLELVGQKVDVNALREASLSLAGDLPVVKEAFDTARGGMIEHVVLTSRGKSWQDLLEPDNMDISGTIHGMRVHVPGIALDLEGVAGRLSLSQGMFRGEDLIAQAGDAHASNGQLSMGTKGDDPPFHVDVNIRTDLAQVPSMLAGIVEDQDFLEELKKITRVDGAAQGRLVLGDRLHSVRAKVEIGEMSLRGDYDGLPSSVEISRGRFSYEGSRISWSDLHGRMGREQIAQAEGRIDWAQSTSLNLAAEQAVFDLGEIQPWLAAIPGAPVELKEVRSARGSMTLNGLRLQGPLYRPLEWAFDAKGELQDTSIDSPGLPGILKIGKARFISTPERIEVNGAQVSLADAVLGLSGAILGYMKTEPRLSLDFQGNIGPSLKNWISDKLDLPPEIRVRGPLSVSKGSLVWDKDKEVSVQGNFSVSGGPLITLDMSKGLLHDAIDIRNMTIDGPNGRASMSIKLGEKEIGFGFKGSLSAATIQQIFESKENFGSIAGDFTARILRGDPMLSTLNGNLVASNVAVPGGTRVHKISLKGFGDGARVDYAEIGRNGREIAVAETEVSFREKRLELRIGAGRLCEPSTGAKENEIPTLSCDVEAGKVSGRLDLSGKGPGSGKFTISSGEGRIYRFGLLAKILSVVNITEILKGDVPDLAGKGFPFNSSSFEGEIGNDGVIDLKEGSINAPSMNLAFDGSVNPPEKTLNMTVLVAPLKIVGSILNRIPIVSGILGKDFVAIPVKVKGDWSNPTVIPMSPSAVGSKLLGVVERTLKLPLKPFQFLFGDKGKKEGKSEE